MNMIETIIIGIVCFVLGGGVVEGINLASPPKTVNQNNYQTVENYTTVDSKNSSIQNSMQGQVTAIIDPGMSNQQYFNINIAGATNITISRSQTSNTVSTTNKISVTNK
jgi:hypothetical protein